MDVDPDEELARQLHREMNGLTRVRHRAGVPPLPGNSFVEKRPYDQSMPAKACPSALLLK